MTKPRAKYLALVPNLSQPRWQEIDMVANFATRNIFRKASLHAK